MEDTLLHMAAMSPTPAPAAFPSVEYTAILTAVGLRPRDGLLNREEQQVLVLMLPDLTSLSARRDGRLAFLRLFLTCTDGVNLSDKEVTSPDIGARELEPMRALGRARLGRASGRVRGNALSGGDTKSMSLVLGGRALDALSRTNLVLDVESEDIARDLLGSSWLARDASGGFVPGEKLEFLSECIRPARLTLHWTVRVRGHAHVPPTCILGEIRLGRGANRGLGSSSPVAASTPGENP